WSSSSCSRFSCRCVMTPPGAHLPLRLSSRCPCCASALPRFFFNDPAPPEIYTLSLHDALPISRFSRSRRTGEPHRRHRAEHPRQDRKSTRLNSSHVKISYAVFCLKKKKPSFVNASSCSASPSASTPPPTRSARAASRTHTPPSS